MEKDDHHMYWMDYHSHTNCSTDSTATLAQQAEAAFQAGIREMCVTDHWNLLDQQANPLPHSYDWTTPLANWKEARNRFAGKVEIRLGVEVGNGVLDPEGVEASLALPELDFVIGSLHNQSAAAGGKGIFTVAKASKTREDCVALLQDYMDTLDALTDTAGFDVLGHIIYPLRYLPPQYELDLKPWWDQLAHILQKVIRSGRGIELNTTQGDTVEQWTDLLRLYHDLGGEILTLGSDAHRPACMGAAISRAGALAKEAGFRYLATYRTRTPAFVKLV